MNSQIPPHVPRCSLIIPQHGQPELTLASVRSCQAHHTVSHQIIIVDDGSPRDAFEQLRNGLSPKFPRVTLIRFPRRQGVTAAWNAGAELAREEFLVFLNNDTFTRGPWIDQLISPLYSQNAEMTGPGWRFEPGFPRTLLERNPRRQLLAGWCLGLRRETFMRLGGFDPRLELYFSDTDLQCRLFRHSLKTQPLCAVHELLLDHLAHRTTRQLSARTGHWHRDRQRFLRKWKCLPLPSQVAHS